jgi:hypothetical protein
MPNDGDLYWQRRLGELLLQTQRLPTALGNETFTAAALLFRATLFASRNTQPFAMAAASVSERFPEIGRLDARLGETEPAALATIGIAIALAGVTITRLERPRLPPAVIAALAADRIPRRLFCDVVVAKRGGAMADTLATIGWTVASQDGTYVAFRRE